mmetsp:Transcript_25008/g.63692  ORF Transcript_25008/g.63692 Transcript_25008/m.63692 type:complete len:276 (+) Transcript_25008:663-1490(+)
MPTTGRRVSSSGSRLRSTTATTRRRREAGRVTIRMLLLCCLGRHSGMVVRSSHSRRARFASLGLALPPRARVAAAAATGMAPPSLASSTSSCSLARCSSRAGLRASAIVRVGKRRSYNSSLRNSATVYQPCQPHGRALIRRRRPPAPGRDSQLQTSRPLATRLLCLPRAHHNPRWRDGDKWRPGGEVARVSHARYLTQYTHKHALAHVYSLSHGKRENDAHDVKLDGAVSRSEARERGWSVVWAVQLGRECERVRTWSWTCRGCQGGLQTVRVLQ